MLKKNLDRSGRIFRFVIATLLLIFAIWQKSWVILMISLFVFFEAFMSWCVMYQLLGKSSCPIDSDCNQNDKSKEN